MKKEPAVKAVLSRQTIAVGSGKGGVGKSTVAVNLAIAFARQGFRVGLLDADLYGPSIPLMLGLRNLSPQTTQDKEGNELILPFSKFQIQAVSIGFFVEEARSVLWRGPILHGAIEKMIHGVFWGELDLLIIDLPPGTGDIPISLSKLLQVDQALIVTTPQECAMIDAVKAINSFDLLQIPLSGIIENMAGFTAPETGITYPIFGQGKADELASRFQVPILGRIPLHPAIRQGGDEGFPAACSQQNQGIGNVFHSIVNTMYKKE